MGNLTQYQSDITSAGSGSYEPLNIGFFVDRTWYLAWPNVIGRAWLYQHNNREKALKIENCECITLPTADDRWYIDLLSKDPYKTLKALEAEGFVYLANSEAAEEDWEKWFFTKIIVRTRTQAVSVEVKAGSDATAGNTQYYNHEDNGYSRVNMWKEHINGTGHFLVLTLPPKPEEPQNFSVALSDYKASNKIYPLC